MRLGHAALETALSQERVEATLNSLIEKGRVEYDPENEVIWVVNAAKYQVTGGNQNINIERHLHSLHGSQLIYRFCERYGYNFEGESEHRIKGPGQGALQVPKGAISEGVQQALNKGFTKSGAPQEQEQEQEQELEQNKNKNVTPKDGGNRTPVFTETIEAHQMAVLLSQLMIENDPKAKTPKNTDQWAVELDRLNRIDGRSWKDIEAVILWCQSDDFWRSNIHSASKLRKQFGKLFLSVNRNRNGGRKSVTAGNMAALKEVLNDERF